VDAEQVGWSMRVWAVSVADLRRSDGSAPVPGRGVHHETDLDSHAGGVARHDCRVTAPAHVPTARRASAAGPATATGPATAGRAPNRSRRRGRRRVAAALVGLILGFLALLAGPATPAAAHAGLVGASPAQNSLVAQPPVQVVLTWTENVTPVTGKVHVIAPDGTRADTGEVKAQNSQLIIPLKPGGPNGTYLVSFRVISADSHPVGGAYTFSVGAPSAPPLDNEVSITANPVVVDAFPVARWIGYAGLVLLVGAVLVLTLLWPQRLDRSGPTRVIWLGAGLVALSTLAELYLQIPYTAGGAVFDIRGADVQEVLSSQYGAAHLVRLGVLVAALILMRPIIKGKGFGADRVLLGALGVIGVITWSISGHPSASKVPLVTVAADLLHISAMSVWLGGLVMLAVFLLPKASAGELGAIVPVWSRWATYAVAVLVLTGVAQAIVLVGSVDALVTSTYGWLLLVKASLVLGILGVAGLSRRMVAPVEAQADGSARRLRGFVFAEAGVAVVVLGLTSVLVQTTPASTANQSLPSSQTATMHSPLFNLSIDVEPAGVGENQIHMYATTLDGQPATVVEWHVSAANAGSGIEDIDAQVLPISSDHAIGSIGLPASGTWKFKFDLRVSDKDEDVVFADVQVAK
jgi:copper transport protein